MKQGDFSYFLTIPNGANRFTIYDPRSARLQGTTVTRTPFPGNQGVQLLNPTTRLYSSFLPHPNNIAPRSAKVGERLLATAMPKRRSTTPSSTATTLPSRRTTA